MSQPPKCVKHISMVQNYLSDIHVEVGCDEAGRGCLAGDVFAAAIIWPKDLYLEELNDSKLLNPEKRECLRTIIEEKAIDWAVGTSSVEEIDKWNILNAAIMAMHRALDQIGQKFNYILVDGNRFKPYQQIPHQTIVKGDGKYASIAAASILAKTYRDDYMKKLAKDYPEYHFEKHKGYATRLHRNIIAECGYSEVHRKSFKLKK